MKTTTLYLALCAIMSMIVTSQAAAPVCEHDQFRCDSGKFVTRVPPDCNFASCDADVNTPRLGDSMSANSTSNASNETAVGNSTEAPKNASSVTEAPKNETASGTEAPKNEETAAVEISKNETAPASETPKNETMPATESPKNDSNTETKTPESTTASSTPASSTKAPADASEKTTKPQATEAPKENPASSDSTPASSTPSVEGKDPSQTQSPESSNSSSTSANETAANSENGSPSDVPNWKVLTDLNTVHVKNSTELGFKAWKDACPTFNVSVKSGHYAEEGNSSMAMKLVVDVECHGMKARGDFEGEFVIIVNHTDPSRYRVLECGEVSINEKNETVFENWLAMLESTAICATPNERLRLVEDLSKEALMSKTPDEQTPSNENGFVDELLKMDSKTMTIVGAGAMAFILVVILAAVAISKRKNSGAESRSILEEGSECSDLEDERDADESAVEIMLDDDDSEDENSKDSGVISDVDSETSLIKDKDLAAASASAVEEGSFVNSPTKGKKED